MLPDSDWKAEDQPGVRSRTSGGNKDKDNEDGQGGDIQLNPYLRTPLLAGHLSNKDSRFFHQNLDFS